MATKLVQLEREQEPRRASVRNFGLIWICGRAGGRELSLALQGRRRWQELSARVSGVSFRPVGCLVVARHAAELELMEDACARDDAGERGFRMLGPDETRVVNPSLRDVLGALHSPLDAIVEPAAALAGLRTLAAASGRYRFLPGRTVAEVDGNQVWDHRGQRFDADLVAICTGTSTELLPLERVESAGWCAATCRC